MNRFLLALTALLLALPASATTFNSTAETFTAADATGLSLGALANYAFVDLGPSTTTLGWNSGPINGSALVGNGVNVSLSGGNNGGFTNPTTQFLFTDGTANITGSLQNPITQQSVTTAFTAAARSTAANVSTFASGLGISPTLNLGAVTGTVTINGTAGLNVIDMTSFQNVALTLNGPSTAFFVINLPGELQTNLAMTLSGGVTAANVLWNLTGTSGQVLNTSGGNSLVGTFLATDGGQFQFSELRLDGEFINTDGNVQLVSGSQIGTAEGFTTPLPGTLPLMATAVVLGFALLRKRRRSGPATAFRFPPAA